MVQFYSTILSNSSIAKDFYKLIFSWNNSIPVPGPGQFLTIRVTDTTVPLLRRPFAFSGYTDSLNAASIIYQKRGIATELLAGKSPGEKLDIIGPLGNCFIVDTNIKRIIAIAGGIGLGPMVFVTEYFKNRDLDIIFIFGCRYKVYILHSSLFSSVTPVICTDNGSAGFHGTPVDYLRTFDKSIFSESILFACGPHPMLNGCHEFALEYNFPCMVSMEQIMACGVGACMGCCVKSVKDTGFARVCSDGAIFNSRDILWT